MKMPRCDNMPAILERCDCCAYPLKRHLIGQQVHAKRSIQLKARRVCIYCLRCDRRRHRASVTFQVVDHDYIPLSGFNYYTFGRKGGGGHASKWF